MMKCSWSTLVTTATLLAVITIVHFSFFPSLDYFRVPQFYSSVNNNSTTRGVGDNVTRIDVPVDDLENRLRGYFVNAVVYRGAPWKAEIGDWLSRCDATVVEIDVVEVL